MKQDAISREVTLLNKYGMHVRPAGLFAKVASRYKSDIKVEKDGNLVSAKSIMALLTLEATMGSVLKITAVGCDSEEALEDLASLVERRFDLPDEQ